MIKIGLFWRTIKHLTIRQIVYQVIYRLRRPAKLRLPKTGPIVNLLAVPAADKPISWRNDEFAFLNQSVHFATRIGWNYDSLGKLWTYHLNYFDFLNQPGMTPTTGLCLILDFVAQTADQQIGLESYPTSLRIQNWVQFLSRHQLQNEAVNRHLWAQVALVDQRLEYHLSGNHLLENAFALLTGALYFQNERWFRKAVWLVRQELTMQVLVDGGHYERSPVYHQLLLDRLLDALLNLQGITAFQDSGFVNFLRYQATRMLHFLIGITFRNGDVAMVNDAAPGMAPSTAQLGQKAVSVGISWTDAPAALTESGYRMFRQSRCELLADVGLVGPNHQPGHAHADTLSFVLYVDNRPVLVDTDTSTYQSGCRREWERSTAAHNTVTIDGSDSSEVWASFRIGRRARVTVLTDTQTELIARHDGYRRLGCLHERTWRLEPTRLIIVDQLLNVQTGARLDRSGVARFYFHPSVSVHSIGDTIRAGSLKITLFSATKPEFAVIRAQLADGFNRLQPAYCLEVSFSGELETVLTLCE